MGCRYRKVPTQALSHNECTASILPCKPTMADDDDDDDDDDDSEDDGYDYDDDGE